MTRSAADRFAALFRGFTRAHGVFRIKAKNERGKYVGSATTVAGPAPIEEHLEGKYGVGIIPLDDDCRVSWAAIDVDKYDLRIGDIADKVRKLGLPLVACESKSGGTHLYLFLREPHDPDTVRDTLNKWAARLGVGGSEVFPKQSYRATERDLGNWINMPYFASSERRCWHGDGFVSLDAFLDIAEATATSLDAPEDVQVPPELEGAPPCLCQFATTGGAPDGTKHNALYALIVYCRKRHPDDWNEKVHALQRHIFNPPLSVADIERNIKSITRKEYDYQCATPYCNKALCRKAEFGRGSGGGDLSVEIGSITKLVGDPVLWVVDIDGHRVLCKTEDLQHQNRFNKLCMDKVTRCPVPIAQPKWLKLIDEKLRLADIVESPQDTTDTGRFHELFEKFIGSENRRAFDVDELVLGKPYLHEGTVYFRSSGLFAYLRDQRFEYESEHKVWVWLRALGASNTQKNIKGKTWQVWSVPMSKFAKEERDEQA